MRREDHRCEAGNLLAFSEKPKARGIFSEGPFGKKRNRQRRSPAIASAEIIRYGTRCRREAPDREHQEGVPESVEVDDLGYGLDCRPFNLSPEKGNDWRTSDLRAWLGNTFLSGAFSSDELAWIREVTCLSAEEAKRYFKDDRDRICRPTVYAKQQGAYVSDSFGSCYWWLRSPGSVSTHAAGVSLSDDVFSDDYVYLVGWNVDSAITAVRPALILDLRCLRPHAGRMAGFRGAARKTDR